MSNKPGLTGAAPLSHGDIVAGRYQVMDEIGRGGYAIVYKAKDVRSGDLIALKTIRPVAPRPDEVRERFRREAEMVSRLKHPNTVRVFDYGFEPDLYLAMELLQGEALSDVLDGVNGIGQERSVRIACGVLESLTEAHALGIVHRDLKPENVFLMQYPDGREEVKVLDFGIAKLIYDQSQPALTLKGRAMGTPTYMSPEQAKGARLTIESDIYSVGVLFYEMLCGVPPFQGENAMAVMLKHVNDPPPKLTVESLQGTHFEKAILHALAKKPSDRFSDANEFLDALGGNADRATASLPAVGALNTSKPKASGLPRQNLFGNWFKRR